MAAHLRVFPPSQQSRTPKKPRAKVPMRLEDLLPILTEAYRHNYTWLQDFLEDDVIVTEDLYEVLRSFRCYRPSA